MPRTNSKQGQPTRLFKNLRILVARSIVRNIENTELLPKHIDEFDHNRELFDEYSMRYFLLWMFTRYGSKEYSKDIEKEIRKTITFSKDSLMTTNWYPFQTNLKLIDETAIITSVFDLLDSHFRSQSAGAQDLAKPHSIGLLYEHLHSFQIAPPSGSGALDYKDIRLENSSKYHRRSKGQYYTPPDIVRYCIHKALKQSSTDLIKPGSGDASIYSADTKSKYRQYRILDPACGTGNFLVGFIDYALDSEAGQEWIYDLVCTSLFGMDLDGRAVALARSSLLLRIYAVMKQKSSSWQRNELSRVIQALSENIIVIDSILAVLPEERTSLLFDGRISGGFDLVITNPPYLSFGARNQPIIEKVSTSLLKKYFADSAEYKIRLNAIFHDVCFRMAKQLGGKITLLVPDGFLTGRRYSRLRKAILSKTRIISLSELPDTSIPGATVGRWCVPVLERRADESEEDYQIELESFCQSNDYTPNKAVFSLPLSHLVSSEHQRFHMVFTSEDDAIAQHMLQFAPLRTYLRGHTGIRSRIGQRNVVAQKREGENWRPGLISGSSVKPFSIEWTGHFIEISPEKLFAGGFDETVIENEKILVRQTGDRLVAALDRDGYYHLNNIHSFSDKKLKKEHQPKRIALKDLSLLEFFTALLNSDLFLYLYRLRTREAGRALAQIDIETLEAMPVPDLESETPNKLAQRIVHLCQPDERKQNKTAHEMNRLIYEAYKLSEANINHIESVLGTSVNSEHSAHLKDFSMLKPVRKPG
ncbi:N-6 DNA methylase [bacterium]|nr:N-6 DNA methylase [bacterium]